MDRLTIFNSGATEVSLKTEENNSIDTVVEKQEKIVRELQLTRKGHEAWSWGDEVEDSDEVDLEEINNG